MPTSLSLPPHVGVGLKPQHYAEALEEVSASIHPRGQPPAWFEVHPQNYFGAGGPPHRWLAAFAEIAPLGFSSLRVSGLSQCFGWNVMAVKREEFWRDSHSGVPANKWL